MPLSSTQGIVTLSLELERVVSTPGMKPGACTDRASIEMAEYEYEKSGFPIENSNRMKASCTHSSNGSHFFANHFFAKLNCVGWDVGSPQAIPATLENARSAARVDRLVLSL